MLEEENAIAIVGAGPVGLACALRLASFEIPSVVFEAAPALPTRRWTTCSIPGDVLAILDPVGVAEEIVRDGVPWRVERFYARGREDSATEYAATAGFPPYVNLTQHRVQELMLSRLRSGSLVQLRWSHRVVGVQQDARGVQVETCTPWGGRSSRFPFLVACDGVRSDVRWLLDVPWVEHQPGQSFLVADVRAALPLTRERHVHQDPFARSGGLFVLSPQPQNRWRVDWRLAPGEVVDPTEKNGPFERRVRELFGDLPFQVCSWSTCRFRAGSAARLRVGRVLFAGGAAHELPYGAGGMDAGIRDVNNLAWKLDLVRSGIQADAAEALLESYHTERHAHRGGLAPDSAILSTGRRARLHQLLGRSFVLLYFASSPGDARRFAEETLSRRAAIPFQLHIVLPAGVDAPPLPATVSVAHAQGPELHDVYRAGRPHWILVRPDCHIASAGVQPDELPGGAAELFSLPVRRTAGDFHPGPSG